MADCIIKIDGAEIIIDGISFKEFERDRDDRGRPSGPAKPPYILITRNPLYNPKVIVDWYQKRNGRKVTIELREEINEQSTSVTIELEDAYVVDYDMRYDVTGTRNITEECKLTARIISIEGVKFEWQWPSM